MTNYLKCFSACCIAGLLTGMQPCDAQNTTSPYSILGIGDIETKDFGRWYGMGSSSVALASPLFVNASNPASLTSLDERMMIFDLANRGKSAKFRYAGVDTFTNTAKDFSIRRISLAFKINKNCAFSVGLKPYSTINYLLSEDNTINGSSALSKQVDGSGGLNQVYFSLARKLNKRLSVGITSSYYFGSANIKTQYYGEQLALALDRQQYDIMSAFQFQAGLQYVANTSGKVNHRFGLTISNPATISQRTETEYLNNNVSIKTVNSTKKNFSLPLAASVGYAAVFNKAFTVSVDAAFSNWKKQKVDYPNSYTTPSGRISAGFEYANRKQINGYSYEAWYLQAGVNAEKNYISILNNPLYSYSFSAGFGKNLSRQFSFYSGIEFGQKGDKAYGQITEKYTQYVVGLTFKEFWFNTKKYGRFQ